MTTSEIQFWGGSRGLGREMAFAATEVVGAALYLISDASSYTSRAILRVEGGMPTARSLPVMKGPSATVDGQYEQPAHAITLLSTST